MAIFFLQALASGGIYIRIPDVKLSLGLSEAELGLMLAAQPVGGFFCFLVASSVVERFGTKPVCLITIPLLAFTSFLFAATPSWAVAVTAMLLFGMSYSLVNVAMNVEADRVEADLAKRLMSRCHGAWSMGFLAASLIGVVATGLGISAPWHLGLVLPLILITSVPVVLRLIPSPAREHAKTQKAPLINLPSLATLGIVGFGLVGSVAQGGTQNWSVLYMRDSFEAPDWIDALSIPVFLIALTVGRLLGDGWLTRYGPRKVGIGLVAAALFGLLQVLIAPGVWVALSGFAWLGIGASIMFPMMVTAAAALGDRPASANVAAVTMATGLGMLMVPPIMGYMAENFGMRAAFGAMLPVYLMGFVMVRFIVPRKAD